MLLLAVALTGSGCGSSGNSPSTDGSAKSQIQPEAALKDRAASKAEAICRASLQEVGSLGQRFPEELAKDRSPDAISRVLIRPGIEILRRESTRLARIEAQAKSSGFESFVGLFYPVIELSEQRVEAGEAGEASRLRSLELLIAGLIDEQVTLAKNLGLDACSIGFTEALGGQK